MAKFQVPQFIEQKPKIVGPLTLQQFIYLASAAAVSFLSFYMFSPLFSVIITIV
ncbi:MAG: PrgI family mobile element protein, partial [Candidatus Magasanikbacteria bacterium]